MLRRVGFRVGSVGRGGWRGGFGGRVVGLGLAGGALGLVGGVSAGEEGGGGDVGSAKRAAAHKAVFDFVGPGMKLGIGSGSTIVPAVSLLGELYRAGELPGVVCVPTSFQARELIVSNGLPLSDLEQTAELDLAIDGADEVEQGTLHLIKGGGGCHTLEKLVAFAAKRLVIVADESKQSKVLGSRWKKGVPVEVLPTARVLVTNAIQSMGATVSLRPGKPAKAGPAVTDLGNVILDCDFGHIQDPQRTHDSLVAIPGVVETGIFPNMATVAIFGKPDGTTTRWEKEKGPK